MNKNFFEDLFKSYYKELCFFARQFINDLDKCQDIVQEVFLNIWEKENLPDNKQQIRNYLYTSVRNRSLNYIRDNKKLVNTSEFPYNIWAEHTNKTEYKELEKMINQAISELPPKCREIFELQRFHGLKYNQIAQTLGISVKTVEAQMTKALKVLRERIESQIKQSIFFFLRIFSFLHKGKSSNLCL